MAKILSLIPEAVINHKLEKYLLTFGWKLIHRGKVRETYSNGGKYLLVVATDQISIFDFVLCLLVLGKGEGLTGLTHFWLTNVLKIRNHLVQSKINPLFNGAYDLRENGMSELPIERCLLVKDLRGYMDPFELIFRHHLGGSVYNDYLKKGRVAGVFVKPNKQKWAKMSSPLFTPSTKAEVGHDVNVDTWLYYKRTGPAGTKFENLLRRNYKKAYQFAQAKGILILDTKFEGSSNKRMVADEILTPDSSRFVYTRDWLIAMEEKKEPPFLDKQIVREWGEKVRLPNGEKGLKKLDPENPEHLKFVHNLRIPSHIVNKVQKNYHELFRGLTGMTVRQYQKERMGV